MDFTFEWLLPLTPLSFPSNVWVEIVRYLSTIDPSYALQPMTTFHSNYLYFLGHPDSRLIIEEELAAEIKSIYDGLNMVESECSTEIYYLPHMRLVRWRKVKAFEMSKQLVVQRGIGHYTERRCGLKMTVNGESVDGFGDTGSSHNIVDAEWVKKRNITLVDELKDLTMGNGSRLHSPGYVELKVRFARERVEGQKIVARVVKSFPFDLLLSRLFLETTRTLKQFIHRFTKCVFPRLKAFLSMNLLSGEPDREQFHGLFNDDIEFEAVLDTGSNCNIMRRDWARTHHLHVSTDDKHRGWISLPSNERVSTIGRVYVDMTLPDDKTIPLEFQVLEETAVPIILGDDVVLDHDLYSTYPDTIHNIREEALTDGVLMLDYMPWYATVVQKAKQKFAAESTSPSQTIVMNPNESKRRWVWNKKYSYGKTAPATEWAEEYKRREMHEKAQPGCGNTRYDVRLIRDVSLDLPASIGEQPFRPSAGRPVASTQM